MIIIYDLVFLLITIFYLPLYLFRRKFHHGFLTRLGFLPKGLDLGRPIWIHAVSVGEALSLRPLLEGLRKTYPQKKFVISTVTATGNKIARSYADSGDFVTYLPLDFSFIVSCVLNKIKPSLFIVAETEFWPNLLTRLYKKNIPVLVVNARISDRSLSGYRIIGFLIKPLLDKISLFCAQSERDRERLVLLGVRPDKIRVAGNLKFDGADLKKDYTDYRPKLGLRHNEKLFIAASTHPQEEEIVLDVYKKLLAEFNYLRLLIAPRHPERSAQIMNAIGNHGFNPVRTSSLSEETGQRGDGETVFVLDTIGQLIDFYRICDIVFVGGSFAKVGGHNILEPALLGKPVFFGPHMFNFRDIAALFLENKAAVMAHSENELYLKIREALNNPEGLKSSAQRAQSLILQNQGATRKSLDCIRSIYDKIQENKGC